jgi:serine protein kinase
MSGIDKTDNKEPLSHELNFDSIIEGTKKISEKKKAKHKIITFREFLGIYGKGEAHDSSARELVHRTMLQSGIFDELYEWEETIEQVSRFVEAGINDPVITGRKGLGLISPPGSGKTTYIKLLSWGLQRLSERLNLFEIQGCPVHHSPLFLVPQYLRAETWDGEKAKEVGFTKPIERTLGIRNIVGDLCVECSHRLRDEFNGEWWNFPIESFEHSIRRRRGFGDFKPSNEKNADISSLVGRENLGITQNPKYGYSHPKAWDLRSGIVEQSSRGFLHVIEGLMKDNDTSMLRTLLSLMSDKYIIIEGSPFPLTYVDVFVMLDANLNGFKWFNGLDGEEALHDRMKFIFGYYCLDWRNEVKIYRKLIESDDNLYSLRKCHKDPKAFEIAAKFAVMARLAPSSLIKSFVNQMEILSDESTTTEDGKEIEKEALIRESRSSSDPSKHSGMFGPSPRLIVSALSEAVATEEEGGCLTLKKTIAALRAVFENMTQAGISPEERTRMSDFLKSGGTNSIFPIYDKMDRTIVNKAFLRTYGDLSKAWFEEYLQECIIWCQLHTPISKGWGIKPEKDALGKAREANEKHLRKIESHWNPPVPDSGRMVHRQQQLIASRLYPDFSYGQYLPLTNACDEALLSESKDILLAVIAEGGIQDEKPDIKNRKTTLLENLMSSDTDIGGHCHLCAKDKVQHVRELLTK